MLSTLTPVSALPTMLRKRPSSSDSDLSSDASYPAILPVNTSLKKKRRFLPTPPTYVNPKKRAFSALIDVELPERLKRVALSDNNDHVNNHYGKISTPALVKEQRPVEMQELVEKKNQVVVKEKEENHLALIKRPPALTWNHLEKIQQYWPKFTLESFEPRGNDVYGVKSGWQMVLYRPSTSFASSGSSIVELPDSDTEEEDEVLERLASMELD